MSYPLTVGQKNGKSQLTAAPQARVTQESTPPKRQKFIDAAAGERWAIDDDGVLVLDEPEFFTEPNLELKRQLYFLHRYLTWHMVIHAVDVIGQGKIVIILRSDGWMGRWKHVKYGRIKNDELTVYYGWILATHVENARKIRPQS